MSERKADTIPKLGKLIEAGEQRDAIHIAVAPVIAAANLLPAQPIGFAILGDAEKVGPSDTPIGIVDPFLKGFVSPGQRFWMFLYPNTITSLRHLWTHPAFADQAVTVADPKEASKAWLTEFADEVDLSYNALLRAAQDWIATGEYHTLSFDTPERTYKDAPLFWKHFEIVTGEMVPRDKAEPFFSCSC